MGILTRRVVGKFTDKFENKFGMDITGSTIFRLPLVDAVDNTIRLGRIGAQLNAIQHKSDVPHISEKGLKEKRLQEEKAYVSGKLVAAVSAVDKQFATDSGLNGASSIVDEMRREARQMLFITGGTSAAFLIAACVGILQDWHIMVVGVTGGAFGAAIASLINDVREYGVLGAIKQVLSMKDKTLRVR
jgi:hypothetical protein